MSVNADKQDLRIRKTHMALKDALFDLLSKNKFDKITVNDLCLEALVSRTAFYDHFEDKYALLSFSLEEIKKDIESYESEHSNTENVLKMNEYIQKNSKLLRNLIDESNIELMNILISLIAKDVSQRLFPDGDLNEYDRALVNFCAGGFANLLIWQLRNNFPMGNSDLGKYIDRILKTLKDNRS